MILATQSRFKLAHHSAGQPETMPSGARAGGVPSIGPRPGSLRSRSRRRSISASRALAMLTLLPVHATSVPRVHVEPRQPDGTLRVLDRFTGQQLIVYTPRFTQQFRAGHRSGRWYVRHVNHVGTDPTSQSFPTARGAIQGVTAGRWRLRSGPAKGPEEQIRVILPASDPSRTDAS
jgi:hypothetical protein